MHTHMQARTHTPLSHWLMNLCVVPWDVGVPTCCCNLRVQTASSAPSRQGLRWLNRSHLSPSGMPPSFKLDTWGEVPSGLNTSQVSLSLRTIVNKSTKRSNWEGLERRNLQQTYQSCYPGQLSWLLQYSTLNSPGSRFWEAISTSNSPGKWSKKYF